MSIQPSGSLLELCVLACLGQEDLYGYRLTRKLSELFSLSESTLYPVLRRLKSCGYLQVYDRNFDGRNRRYYALTPEGRLRLSQLEEDWQQLGKGVEVCLKGKSDHE